MLEVNSWNHPGLQDCPGYFGHIELAKPMFHIGFIRNVLKVLRAVSFHNSKVMLPKVRLLLLGSCSCACAYPSPVQATLLCLIYNLEVLVPRSDGVICSAQCVRLCWGPGRRTR